MKDLAAFYKGKNVLVTGGAGFIGSHLVEKLISLESRVTVLDNFSSGKLSNLKSVVSQVNFIYTDITSPYGCLKATNNADIVFHLAAFISVPRSMQNPHVCNTINIQGTKNILEACRQNEVKTFLYSSSAAVYGNRTDPCKEGDTPNPQSPYAQSKLEGEKLCQHYSQNYHLSTACLRYFNVYGARQNINGRYAAVVAKFKQKLLKKESITIYGDGKQTRDFTPVESVVEANLKIAMAPQLNGDVFNVATGKSINLFQLIEKLEKELNIKHTKIAFEATRQGDIVHSGANCEKYKKTTFSL